MSKRSNPFAGGFHACTVQQFKLTVPKRKNAATRHNLRVGVHAECSHQYLRWKTRGFKVGNAGGEDNRVLGELEDNHKPSYSKNTPKDLFLVIIGRRSLLFVNGGHIPWKKCKRIGDKLKIEQRRKTHPARWQVLIHLACWPRTAKGKVLLMCLVLLVANACLLITDFSTGTGAV